MRIIFKEGDEFELIRGTRLITKEGALVNNNEVLSLLRCGCVEDWSKRDPGSTCLFSSMVICVDCSMHPWALKEDGEHIVKMLSFL